MRSAFPLAKLSATTPDAVLKLMNTMRKDPRPGKIDLGIGVFRDSRAKTPIFEAVKAAERMLVETQETKSYLGSDGDLEFLANLKMLIFGNGSAAHGFAAIQTPGGTAALRLVAELVHAGAPGARVFVGAPTWPNHPPIFAAAGVPLVAFPHSRTHGFNMEAYAMAIEQAAAGDFLLVHGACHNPTGIDASLEDWRLLADLCARHHVTPIIDLAYHGLGDGPDEDLASTRLLALQCEGAILAYSCSKNFGLYRERTGAVFVRAGENETLVRDSAKQIARTMWSMPPDHGAAIVRLILDDKVLSALWRAELAAMRERLAHLRSALAAEHPDFVFMARQKGMFSQFPASPAETTELQRTHAIYMLDNGRINIAGLTDENIPRITAAYASLRTNAPLSSAIKEPL
jgi:aromatic-amino-acid transaminase